MATEDVFDNILAGEAANLETLDRALEERKTSGPAARRRSPAKRSSRQPRVLGQRDEPLMRASAQSALAMSRKGTMRSAKPRSTIL